MVYVSAKLRLRLECFFHFFADMMYIMEQGRTVKVSNVSQSVSERDIFEFFTFSGDIHYIEMRR